MEENTEQRVDLTLFSEKIQELKDRIASVMVRDSRTVIIRAFIRQAEKEMITEEQNVSV